MAPLKRDVIVAPIDFSPATDRILDAALDLAGGDHSRIRTLHVLPPLDTLAPGVAWGAPFPDTREEGVRNHGRTVLRDKRLTDVRFDVRLGHPAHEIIEFAKAEKADLIVIASHGYSGIKRFLLGSVAEMILRHAPCPVLVLRRAE